MADVCRFGCTGDDEAVHFGWFRCTRESRALLAQERLELAQRFADHRSGKTRQKIIDQLAEEL